MYLKETSGLPSKDFMNWVMKHWSSKDTLKSNNKKI